MPRTPDPDPHFRAKLIMHSATIFGRVSLLGFVLFMLTGPFDLITLELPPQGWIFWDTTLSFLFFVQHSTMIRQGLRQQMARVIPPHYHGAFFTLASGLALVILVLLWQPSHIPMIEPSAPLNGLAYSLFIAATAGIIWGVLALKSFDPFGKGAIKAHLSQTPPSETPFTIKGPYRWVRHPLYFFVLVMIWSRADLTADRLLFNLLWSGWIYIGTIWEERDLVTHFGASYQSYQKQVPMLIPWKGLAA